MANPKQAKIVWAGKDGAPITDGVFTHICGTSEPKGYFTVRRKTMGKCMTAKLKEIREEPRKRMLEEIGGTLKWLKSLVRGYFQYHAVPGNEERLKAFLHEALYL